MDRAEAFLAAAEQLIAEHQGVIRRVGASSTKASNALIRSNVGMRNLTTAVENLSAAVLYRTATRPETASLPVQGCHLRLLGR